jgi:hypothetical protein
MTSIRLNTDRVPLRAAVLLALIALLPPAAAAQATLNKCIDAKGKVTYSNLPCRNAREARTVEIAPPPSRDDARPAPVATPPTRRQSPEAAPPSRDATLQLETRATNGKPSSRVSPRACDTLADKLGHVLDEMDRGRRKGYTQAEMDAWNQEIKTLERKKQQSGCF